jgi:hypothetical protein
MKKKIYSQPLVEAMMIAPSSIICAGSPVNPDLQFGGGGNPGGAQAPKKGNPIP